MSDTRIHQELRGADYSFSERFTLAVNAAFLAWMKYVIDAKRLCKIGSGLLTEMGFIDKFKQEIEKIQDAKINEMLVNSEREFEEYTHLLKSSENKQYFLKNNSFDLFKEFFNQHIDLCTEQEINNVLLGFSDKDGEILELAYIVDKRLSFIKDLLVQLQNQRNILQTEYQNANTVSFDPMRLLYSCTHLNDESATQNEVYLTRNQVDELLDLSIQKVEQHKAYLEELGEIIKELALLKIIKIISDSVDSTEIVPVIGQNS